MERVMDFWRRDPLWLIHTYCHHRYFLQCLTPRCISNYIYTWHLTRLIWTRCDCSVSGHMLCYRDDIWNGWYKGAWKVELALFVSPLIPSPIDTECDTLWAFSYRMIVAQMDPQGAMRVRIIWLSRGVHESETEVLGVGCVSWATEGVKVPGLGPGHGLAHLRVGPGPSERERERERNINIF